MTKTKPVTKGKPLSPAEKSVLSGIAAGQTYLQIAESLGIGHESVKTYVKRSKAKLGLTNKVSLGIWASDNLKGAK